MSARTRITVFGTVGCRLCDEVEPAVRRVAARLGHELVYRDIALDPELTDRYGESIPVLRREDQGLELVWPFDTEALYRFLM